MTKHNETAWAHALGWAGLSYFVLVIVAVPRSEDVAAYTAGKMLVPAAVCWGLAWLLAANASRSWAWWVYPLVVPAGAAVLALAFSVPELTNRGELIPELTAPASQGEWTKVENAALLAEVERAENSASDLGPRVESVVAGYYLHGSSPTGILFVGVNGVLEAGGDREESLRQLMTGASVADYETYDPGAPGGVLGCGNAAPQGIEGFTCGWIGRERMILMRWEDRSLEPERAASLTTEFRSLATA